MPSGRLGLIVVSAAGCGACITNSREFPSKACMYSPRQVRAQGAGLRPLRFQPRCRLVFLPFFLVLFAFPVNNTRTKSDSRDLDRKDQLFLHLSGRNFLGSGGDEVRSGYLFSAVVLVYSNGGVGREEDGETRSPSARNAAFLTSHDEA